MGFAEVLSTCVLFSPGETSRQRYLLAAASQIGAFGKQEILSR